MKFEQEPQIPNQEENNIEIRQTEQSAEKIEQNFDEAKINEILEAERQEETEKEKLLEEMVVREDTMVQETLADKKEKESEGVMRKIAGRAKVFVAATAMVLTLMGAKEVAAQSRHFYPGQQRAGQSAEWQSYIKQLNEWAEGQRRLADREYQDTAAAIQREYEQRKFDIMIGRVPGATDYFGKETEYKKLEQWKAGLLNQAQDQRGKRFWQIDYEARSRAGLVR